MVARTPGAGARLAALLAAALAACVLALLPTAPAAADEGRPAVALSLQDAAKGTEITVTGTGWRPKTMVMLLVCGQNMIGGTNSCANADGAAVAVADDGRFAAQLPVVAPPKPCPCVVNVTSVNGDQSTVAAPLKITDHPVAELPAASGTARLAMLTGVRLEGEDGVLTWFGSPPSRKFEVTVGNLGTAPVKDPVFQLGIAHGVFAPLWEEARWKGTIPPGGKAEIALDVALTAGAYGDYTISLKYGETVVAAQPWGVDRPYGVLLFWGLLLVVVPAAVFRVGMAVVDKVRPRAAPAGGRHRGAGTTDAAAAVTARLPRVPRLASVRGPARADRTEPAPPPPQTTTAVLPWFTPDSAPETAPQTSAPSENRSTTKGHS
ncbi:neocarzinostatin apoprotein domain-containing protein [Streptomyces antarcticus]|uniref:neocarzinostatin apoprotein domain-containing protein n=1 Tax=Streptomyces antarcticus TaxID=2996458 RepID=UPI0022721069|nr:MULTISPECIES: neocarzinostatin apoprotein domain-containing protein [unclassified Streptomyces]MCY0942193.1 neocarzinostatin apoprotein domain-containing protein [Streptomyces sp. H34-AA3]MCY0951901.1 neocarzinostatin apoprotein domain-containing protein [Streptomyces sp. H27-S2]MCZ4084476.1 neocarzinostatin apoprotein domain-containing protein [Streptomyces sp. H34-S5]